METPRDPMILEAAQAYAEEDKPIIPLKGKVPAVQDWQHFVANAANVLLFFGKQGCNIGMRTGESGYIVVDTDNERAEAWAVARLPETPMLALSGSGSKHRYFDQPPRKEIRNKQGWKGIHGLDIRGHGGFIVLAPSIHPETGERYRWLTEVLPAEELPRFLPEWVRDRSRRKTMKLLQQSPAYLPSAEWDADFLLVRARAWLTKVAIENPAVSHEGGHNATFRVACRLTHFPRFPGDNSFGLSREQAIGLMMDIYNPCCRPPWRLADIEHKVDDAIKKR